MADGLASTAGGAAGDPDRPARLRACDRRYVAVTARPFDLATLVAERACGLNGADREIAPALPTRRSSSRPRADDADRRRSAQQRPRHTPKGTEVRVELSRRDHGVLLAVEDSGPGVRCREGSSLRAPSTPGEEHGGRSGSGAVRRAQVCRDPGRPSMGRRRCPEVVRRSGCCSGPAGRTRSSRPATGAGAPWAGRARVRHDVALDLRRAAPDRLRSGEEEERLEVVDRIARPGAARPGSKVSRRHRPTGIWPSMPRMSMPS